MNLPSDAHVSGAPSAWLLDSTSSHTDIRRNVGLQQSTSVRSIFQKSVIEKKTVRRSVSKNADIHNLHPTYLNMATYGILSLSCCIVYYYNGAQRYEQFLQVGQLYRALILLGFALLSSERLCILGIYKIKIIENYIKKLYYINFVLLTSFSLPFSELSLVGLALID